MHDVEVGDTLDLHMFRPADTRELVGDYLDDCIERGIFRVRIVHGKGIGVQRERVHALLRERDDVVAFGLCGESGGSWGASWVELRSS